MRYKSTLNGKKSLNNVALQSFPTSCGMNSIVQFFLVLEVRSSELRIFKSNHYVSFVGCMGECRGSLGSYESWEIWGKGRRRTLRPSGMGLETPHKLFVEMPLWKILVGLEHWCSTSLVIKPWKLSTNLGIMTCPPIVRLNNSHSKLSHLGVLYMIYASMWVLWCENVTKYSS